MSSQIAMTIPKRHTFLLLGSAATFFVLDQAVKLWIQAEMTPMQSIAVLPGIFQITFVYNTGAAFSMFEQYPSLLLALTITLFVAIFAIAMTRRVMGKPEAIGFSLVLGGALGNIVDRLTHGKVVDFIDVVCIHYPVFNLADSFIFIGVCILLILQLFPSSNRAR